MTEPITPAEIIARTRRAVARVDREGLRGVTDLVDVGLTYTWHARPSGADAAGVTTLGQTITGRGLVPFAPVWLAAAKASGSNDLTLSWIRRDRDPSADSWDMDVPMSETTEAWEIDILDGATIKRTLTSATTSVTYSAADQTTDFGSAPLASVTFRVFQIGALGRGDGRQATVNVA